jgi:hypothetical protein
MKPLLQFITLFIVILLLTACAHRPARFLVCDTPEQFCYRGNTIDHEYTQFHYGPRGVVRLHQSQQS